MGHAGMKSSLISREIITDSVELTMRGHCYDALVGLAGCDKSLPGMMMAMIRLNVPSVFMYGGSIMPGRFRGRDVTIGDVYEWVGKHSIKDASDEDLHELECVAWLAMPVEMIGWIHPGPVREIRELTTVIEQRLISPGLNVHGREALEVSVELAEEQSPEQARENAYRQKEPRALGHRGLSGDLALGLLVTLRWSKGDSNSRSHPKRCGYGEAPAPKQAPAILRHSLFGYTWDRGFESACSSAESANRPSLGERRGGIRWRADAMVEIEAIAVIDD
jgi:hypothetical protein